MGNYVLAGLALVSKYAQSKQKSENLKYQADIITKQSQYNQKAAELEARDYEDIVKQSTSRAISITGASGFDPISVSAEAPINAIVTRGAQDVADIRTQSKAEAYSSMVEAQQLRSSAAQTNRLNLFTTALDAYDLYRGYSSEQMKIDNRTVTGIYSYEPPTKGIFY